MAGHLLTRAPRRHWQGVGHHASYLIEVDARLQGSRAARDAVLAELRDGLECATDRHIATGLCPDEATQAAMAEFGSPAEVAAAFAHELATGQARRTLRTFLITGPLVGIWWLLLFAPQPWRLGTVAPWGVIPILPLIPLAITIGLAALAATGPLTAWIPEASPQRALSATQAIAALCITADLIMLADLAHRILALPATLSGLAVLAVLASLARLAYATSRIRAGHRVRTALS